MGPDEAAAYPRRRLSRRPAAWCVVAALLVLGLAVGIPYYRHFISHESTDDAFVEGHVVAISARVAGHVAKVHVGDNQWVDAGDPLAELDPRDFQAQLAAAEATLEAARATHRSRAISLDLTRVTSSAALEGARGDVEAATAGVETARAQVAAAASQRDRAKAQLAAAQAALEQAGAELAAVEASHQRDVLDLRRYRQMAEANAISRQQLDHALAAERTSAANRVAARKRIETQQAMVGQARAALKAAEDNLREAETRVNVRMAELDQARARLSAAKAAPSQVALSESQVEASAAEVARARAGVEQARLSLSYTKILAPASGRVTRKAAEPGAHVQVGQSLMAIVRPDVWVVANFKETQLNRIRPGQPVSIRVDTYSGVSFAGRVESIQRGTGARFSLLPPENATGNYIKVVQRVPVKIVFDDPRQLRGYLLVPGMSVVPEVNIAAAVPPRDRSTPASDGPDARPP